MTATRYAIIGSGMMGQEHIRNIQLLDGTEIVALADPDEAMRRSGQQIAGNGCRVFADYRELLGTGLFDVLVMAAPNHLHRQILDDVLALDKPVLAEKPLCTTVADSRRIATLAARRSAPIWVAMEYRYMPAIARLIETVRSGAVGSPRMIAVREHRYPFLDKVGHWNRFVAMSGGTMVEKCCHFFDLMRLLANAEAVRVFASGGMDVNYRNEEYDGRKPDVLDNAFVIVDFKGGVRAMLDLCMFAEGARWQEAIAVTGSAARAEALVPGPARFSAPGTERASEFVLAPRDTKIESREIIELDARVLKAGDHHGATFFQHERFLKLVREGGVAEVTAEDGLKAVEIGAAAEESIRTGKPVHL